MAVLIDQHARARGGEPDPAVLFSVAFAEDGADVFAQACALGCEGIVSAFGSKLTNRRLSLTRWDR